MTVNLSNMNVVSLNQTQPLTSKTNKARVNDQPQKDSVSFTSKNTNYENPVNKSWEYFSAATGPVIFSALAAGAAGLLIKAKEQTGLINKKAAAITAVFALVLTLPVAIYHRSVSAFAKTKEMDVFSREKSAETSLTEQIDDKARDKDVPLDDAINSYTKFEIGKNGRAMGIVNT